MKEEARLWSAVLKRDGRFDDRFVYAVRSTGIYCRPSCPSRRPRREMVVFFSGPQTAEQEGFRPCRRCRPTVANAGSEMIRRLCRYIEEHESSTLQELGDYAGISPFHLQRVFKKTMGVTPRQFAAAKRLTAWKGHLRRGADVTTALYDAGFGSSSRLYEKAGRRLGMTPGVYRKGGKGMRIQYTIVDCPLKRLLVAATERGVCAVYLGDTDAPLIAALRHEYSQADISADAKHMQAWVRRLLEYLRGKQKQPELRLPLDLQATAFQLLVWEELQRIPFGTTRTYSQIARRLGRPTATRAVARACATNPVSLVVPCHRVVREDGNLAGYRWGLERKQALLEQERRARA